MVHASRRPWPAKPSPLLRRQVLALGASALGALAAGPARALAQPDDPGRPIRLVVPFLAGGSSDRVGRLVAGKLGPLLQHSVVVDNKVGADGVVGADLVAKSAPDGHTLLLADVFHTSAPIYTRNMPYDPVRDFTPISLVGRSPAFWVAGPGYPARTAREALADVKARPGQLKMAVAGAGSVVVDLFRARTALQFVSVPFRGSSPALVDLLDGQVHTMITTLASAGAPLRAGKLRALAVTGTRRNPDFPDVPTFAELGIAGMDYEQWFGVLGPARMHAAVVDPLARAMAQVLKMHDVRERLTAMAMDVAQPGPRYMQRQVEDDAARWLRLAMRLGIKPID